MAHTFNSNSCLAEGNFCEFEVSASLIHVRSIITSGFYLGILFLKNQISKYNELICLTEESSKQYTLQVVVWLLPTVCSQIERKTEKERTIEQLDMYSRRKAPCNEGSNL